MPDYRLTGHVSGKGLTRGKDGLQRLNHQSGLFLQCFLQGRSDSKDWPVPIRRRRSITPADLRRVKRDLIPMESLPDAAFRQCLARFLLREPTEFRRYQMFWVPELSRATVGNSRQRTSAWRSPVGRENRFPDNQHSYLPVRVMRKELLCCGRPPQTTRSSRRQ